MNKLCKNCKIPFTAKQRLYCSDTCRKQYISDPVNIKLSRDLAKKTSMEKYGVDNPAKSLYIKNKTKEVCMVKYGGVSPTSNKEVMQKQKDTKFKKYGDEYYTNIEQVKKTLIERYGVDVPFKNPDFIKKSKDTLINKYGVDNYAKLKECHVKMKETCLEKYGVWHAMKNEDIKKRAIKGHLEFNYEELKTRLHCANIELLTKPDEYTHNLFHHRYSVRCLKCDTMFQGQAAHGLTPRCLTCHPLKRSIFEDEIADFIKYIVPNNEEILISDRTVLKPLELDIYIPSKNIAIECNGTYWHSDTIGGKYKNYHVNKTNKCEELNIQLIHIFEDEWKTKKDIIKSKLCHLLNVNGTKDKKIYARNCTIKEIDSNIKNEFLIKNHIQGKDKSSIKLGLFYDRTLVAVMTFGNLRRSMGFKTNKINEYEMYRFCVDTSSLVIGAGGKLLAYFIKNYTPARIISYADRRWSFKTKSIYKTLGFNFLGVTPPNYWYLIHGYDQLQYRYNFRKSELSKKLEVFDPTLSEWQNMKNNGYDRIWDCGHLKYELIF